MIARAFKLRFRRRLRLRKLQVEELGQQAEQQLERNFFKRLERLADVRRFVVTWLALLTLLTGCVIAQIQALGSYYNSPQAVPGGTYSEGIIGSFTNANPIYATGAVDMSVSRLLFSGLFTYDANNNLVGELAEGFTIDPRGTTYSVKLKPGLTWHDGSPLTADDVAFTYQVIQNPDAGSPYRTSWQGIAVKATDRRTVTFTLPNQLSAFPYSLTNGIVPRHLLVGKSMQSLRTVPFNTSQPVGAGPFKFKALEVTGGAANEREERVALEPFDKFYGGRPNIDRFIVHSFRDEAQLIESFKKREVDAMVGLTKVPPGYGHDSTLHIYNLPLTAAVMTFFRTGSEILTDPKVRGALARAVDTETIRLSLEYPARPVRGPLLLNQIGYNPAIVQTGYNPAQAAALLDANGWQTGEDGVRKKDGRPLRLTLYAQDTSEYANVARSLQKQLRAVGVDLEVILKDPSDFQAALSSSSRTYDMLLYGISIGKDPDVYVYWDSKNADVRSANRLNFSEYKSAVADASLQAGRTRADANLRSVKYQQFLQVWRDDAPAVGLYQPRFLYITHHDVNGLEERPINADVERFKNVHAWMFRQADLPQVK